LNLIGNFTDWSVIISLASLLTFHRIQSQFKPIPRCFSWAKSYTRWSELARSDSRPNGCPAIHQTFRHRRRAGNLSRVQSTYKIDYDKILNSLTNWQPWSSEMNYYGNFGPGIPKRHIRNFEQFLPGHCPSGFSV
jgi:hypothetical protein